MKLQCTKFNLLKGLNTVSRVVGTRTTLPVLSNILFSIDKGRLKLTATDLEVGINTWVGAKVDKTGAITIPARLILEFVSNNPDETITISVDKEKIKLESKHYTANISGMAADEFPQVSDIKSEDIIKIDGKRLRQTIAQTVFAAAADDTRPVLAGVLLKNKSADLVIAATDSYRLAEKKIKLAGAAKEDFEVIVPATTLTELGRLLEEEAKEVEITMAENQVEFKFADTKLISRVIEGTFPDYEQIIPKEFPTKLEISKEELTSVMKMASIFARESANNIRFKLAGGKAEVLAISPQLGDNTAILDAKVSGQPLEVAFNAKYILDVLNVLGETGSKVTVAFAGQVNPAVISVPEEKNYLYVLMPLRLEE